jgi:hypothetical protein
MPRIEEHIPEYVLPGDVGRSDRTPFTMVGYDDIHVCQEHGVYAFAVYTYLSLRMGANTAAWPSFRRTAEDLGLAVSTVQKALSVLIDARLVTKHSRPDQQSNLYIVHEPPKTGVPSPGTGVPSHGTGVYRLPVQGVPSHGNEEDSVKKIQLEVDSYMAEPSVSANGSSETKTKKTRLRPADPIWDELVSVIGASPETKNERGRWNAAIVQLREVGATPEQIRLRAAQYKRKYREPVPTPTALVSHWGELNAKPLAPQLPRHMTMTREERWAEQERQSREREERHDGS